MFEILPIQSKEEQKALCELCQIPFRPEMLAYRAVNEGEFCGICQFTMDAQGGSLTDFAWIPEKYDFETLFIMGRAALNFIDLCGVHQAFFDAECKNETLVKAIGFSRNSEGRWAVDLTDFFTGTCKNRK